MTDTVKKVQETAEKFTTDALSFQKDNVAAVVESSKLAFAGAEKAAEHVAAQGRKQFEEASAALKAIAAAKSPTEFFALQNDFAKSSTEAFIKEATVASEAALKFFGDVFQPLSNRFAVAADTMKAAVSA